MVPAFHAYTWSNGGVDRTNGQLLRNLIFYVRSLIRQRGPFILLAYSEVHTVANMRRRGEPYLAKITVMVGSEGLNSATSRNAFSRCRSTKYNSGQQPTYLPLSRYLTSPFCMQRTRPGALLPWW